MEKRSYTHVQELLPRIQTMVAEGKSQREIAEELGLKDKYVVKRLLARERKEEIAGIRKQRGRKAAKTLSEYKYEKKRLKIENE